MPFYTKKPIPIEARQITVENADELSYWCSGHVDVNILTAEKFIKIYTLEGIMTGNLGDYIIKGVKGEFYPCRADIFEETYEEHVERKDDYHVQVIDFVEQPDGSAIMNFEMGRGAMKTFAEIGLLKVLTDEARRVINESEEIDTNVGC